MMRTAFYPAISAEEEQEILLQQLPDLTTRDEKTERWINPLKKIRQTKG